MKTFWLLLLILSLAPAAFADGDLVYSARYYLPPNARGTSHFHVYRINPDGTGRRQLTFGSADDFDARWEPDGRAVFFVRSHTTGPDAFCRVKASGGKVTTLMTLGTDEEWSQFQWQPKGNLFAAVRAAPAPDDPKTTAFTAWVIDFRMGQVVRKVPNAERMAWSPDGLQLFVGTGGQERVVTLKTGASAPLTPFTGYAGFNEAQNPLWLPDGTLVALTLDGTGNSPPLALQTRAPGEAPRPSVRLLLPPPPKIKLGPDDDTPLTLEDFYSAPVGLLPVPHSSKQVLFVWNAHNSTVGVNHIYFYLDTKTGQTSYLAEGRFLNFAPDGTRFCLAPGRDTSPYEKRPDGRERMVWTAPLKIGDRHGKMRTITSGLVLVTYADWRK